MALRSGRGQRGAALRVRRARTGGCLHPTALRPPSRSPLGCRGSGAVGGDLKHSLFQPLLKYTEYGISCILDPGAWSQGGGGGGGRWLNVVANVFVDVGVAGVLGVTKKTGKFSKEEDGVYLRLLKEHGQPVKENEPAWMAFEHRSDSSWRAHAGAFNLVKYRKWQAQEPRRMLWAEGKGYKKTKKEMETYMYVCQSPVGWLRRVVEQETEAGVGLSWGQTGSGSMARVPCPRQHRVETTLSTDTAFSFAPSQKESLAADRVYFEGARALVLWCPGAVPASLPIRQITSQLNVDHGPHCHPRPPRLQAVAVACTMVQVAASALRFPPCMLVTKARGEPSALKSIQGRSRLPTVALVPSWYRTTSSKKNGGSGLPPWSPPSSFCCSRHSSPSREKKCTPRGVSWSTRWNEMLPPLLATQKNGSSGCGPTPNPPGGFCSALTRVSL